jgi:glucose-1-phosphate cytidylyltransferase
MNSNIGQRLAAVKPFLENEKVFLANYADGLTDFHLPTIIDEFLPTKQVATFLSVRPNTSFHFVARREDGTVAAIEDVLGANSWINGGYFVLRREIFDYIRPGEELVEEPFRRLIEEGKLRTHAYDGFWRCIDTFKDLQSLEALHAKGNAPWEVWHRQGELPRVPHTRGTRRREPVAQPWELRARV